MKMFSPQADFRYKGNVRGLSLIELLVSMAIGLIVTLAITTVMVRSEGQQRTSTAVNDASQAGAFSALTLDRAIRSAGSGFTQFRVAMGCLINASTGAGANQILPPLAPLPAPFSNIGTVAVPVVLAPAVIVDGGAAQPDQLIVMSGSHGFSEGPLPVRPGSVAFNSLGLQSTLGMAQGDLILVANNAPGGPCMVQQVGAVVAGSQSLPLAGAYFDSVGGTANLIDFNVTQRTSVVPIGNMGLPPAGAPNPPSFFAYGVDPTDASLKSYDLLNTTGAAVSTVSEGVVSMQALYGVGTASLPAGAPQPPASALVWTAPTAAGFNATNAELLGPAGQATFPTIQAIRVALLLRAPLQEKTDVAPASFTLFPDLTAGLQVTIPISAAEQKFRHRVVDVVIPIRNL